ncbi:MAG: tetratricopeptide repeat protein [Candidatus Eisenbacteria bacterium]
MYPDRYHRATSDLGRRQWLCVLQHLLLRQEYYAQGERARESSTSEELTSPEAVRRYDLAIAQCRKVLNFHAKSRWADDALYLMGASYYGKAAYDSALIVFGDLQRTFPKSKFIDDAIYRSGLCHYERGDYDQMAVEFEEVLQRDPDFEHEDDILYTLARKAEKEGDRPAAVASYRRLVDRFPGSSRAEDGLLQIGRLYFEGEAYDSSLAAYEELVAHTKDQKNYQEGQLQLAQCLMRLGRSEEAIDRLEDQIPRNLHEGRSEEAEYAARVRIVMAQALNRIGEHDRALAQLREVLDKQRDTASAGEAAYLVGYTYESYLDSLGAAETAYEEASKMSARASSFRDLARDRLNNLRRLISLSGQAQDTGDSGSEKAAEAALKIAELQYFSQNEVATALGQYQKVIDQFPETKMAARADYAIGWIQLHDEEVPPDTAFARLRGVVRRHPESTQARAAIDLIQGAGGDTTGLRALLVDVVPDTVAVEVDADSLGAMADSSAFGDSLGLPGSHAHPAPPLLAGRGRGADGGRLDEGRGPGRRFTTGAGGTTIARARSPSGRAAAHAIARGRRFRTRHGAGFPAPDPSPPRSPGRRPTPDAVSDSISSATPSDPNAVALPEASPDSRPSQAPSDSTATATPSDSTATSSPLEGNP